MTTHTSDFARTARIAAALVLSALSGACSEEPASSTSATTAAVAPAVVAPAAPPAPPTPPPTRALTPEEWQDAVQKAIQVMNEPDNTTARGNGVTKDVACIAEGATECALMVHLERDAFEKRRLINSISHQYFVISGKPNLKAYVELKDNGQPVLMLSAVSLERSGWLALNKVAIMATGVVVIEHEFSKTEIERAKTGPFYAELGQFAVSDSQLQALRKVATESDVLIRLRGASTFVTVPKEELEYIQQSLVTSLRAHDILNAALKGKP